MFDLNFENLFNPVLLFWISFFYLVILFHSFGIAKIWNKINGVELLFLSAVVGYVYYIASIYLIFPLINAIKSLIDLSIAMIPSSLLSLQINYSDFTKFFVYLCITILVPIISYFIVIFSIYLVIKFIQYCLDPNDEIFSNYQRFIFLKKVQFSNAIVFSIPAFIFTASVILLCLGGISNTIQNIVISWDSWVMVSTLLQIFVFFLSCIIIYFRNCSAGD